MSNLGGPHKSGFDHGIGGGNKDEPDGKPKSWHQKLIINPKTASWIPTWSMLINICFLYGYLADPWYIAFYIAEDRWGNK